MDRRYYVVGMAVCIAVAVILSLILILYLISGQPGQAPRKITDTDWCYVGKKLQCPDGRSITVEGMYLFNGEALCRARKMNAFGVVGISYFDNKCNQVYVTDEDNNIINP